MNLGNALGIPQDVFRYKPSSKLVLPNDLVGLEFEFEGVKGERVDRHEARSPSVKEGWALYWKVKADGSLHDNGCEWLFSRPLFGEDVIEAVTNLLDYGKKQQWKVSIRTGLHVHVDVRDLTRTQLAVLNVLYALFERAVYRLAGNNREENVFCLPWYKADAMSLHVSNINSEYHDIRAASEALDQEKYGGLNLDSLARFGSVEFRHALATLDSDWVIRWINVCLAFKRAAKKLNVQPLEVIHNLSGVGPENLARIVFEDMFETIWYPELQDDVWRTGVETALMIYPKQQEIIDAANLSWNRVKAPADTQINPRFKSFVERNVPKKPALDIPMDFEARPFANFAVLQANPVILDDPDELPEDLDDEDDE